MTNTELAELFLVRLYDLAESQGYGARHVLNDIAEEFGVTDVMRIHDIARALANRGLIERPNSVSREVEARITTEGAFWVERGGDTGVIPAYRNDPQAFSLTVDQSTHFHAPVSGSALAIHSVVDRQTGGSFEELGQLLDEIQVLLQSDSSLTPRQLEESVADVELLRSELHRARPRPSLVREVLTTLGDTSSIAGLVVQLRQMLASIGLGG